MLSVATDLSTKYLTTHARYTHFLWLLSLESIREREIKSQDCKDSSE
jgi:hypothetical protein